MSAAPFARIPEDPPEMDLAPCEISGSCVGCAFNGLPLDRCPTVRAAAEDGPRFACQPGNRPDQADVIYVPRKTYGNEEDP
jgi:hypothetical protein